MNLAEKLKHLRKIEGDLRGLNRPMTQMEVVTTMREELQESLSQAYLSQIESGKRVHLTASSRSLLARFFKVHPGYLVSDPPDYSTDLLTDIEDGIDRLGTWLVASAQEWSSEPAVQDFLERLASVEDPRRYLVAFGHLLDLSIEELEAIARALNSDEELDTS